MAFEIAIFRMNMGILFLDFVIDHFDSITQDTHTHNISYPNEENRNESKFYRNVFSVDTNRAQFNCKNRTAVVICTTRTAFTAFNNNRRERKPTKKFDYNFAGCFFSSSSFVCYCLDGCCMC